MRTNKSELEKLTRHFHDDADVYDAINNFDYDVKFQSDSVLQNLIVRKKSVGGKR